MWTNWWNEEKKFDFPFKKLVFLLFLLFLNEEKIK